MSKPNLPKKKCAILDCFNPTKNSATPYCSKHHWRWKRNGDPTITLRDREPNLGQSKDPLYKRWWGALCRCEDKKNAHYKDYGGRGITVFTPWRDSFLTFRKYILSTIGLPNPGDYLDRIDNDGNYEPGNIKWSTSKESAANRRVRRDAHLITYNNQTKTLTEWAKDLKLNHSAIINRLNKGWSVEKALTLTAIPRNASRPQTRALFIDFNGETKSLIEWAEQLGMPREQLYNRIYVNKWTIERALTTPMIPRKTKGKT